MSHFPEWNQLDSATQQRVMAAADAAVGNCDLTDAGAIRDCLSSFDGIARLALLRTLLREHLEFISGADGSMPRIDAYLELLATNEEQRVIREVFADELPTLALEIVREIGRGGMGVVLEARQPALGNRRVAVKTLDALAVGQAGLWNRLREEVEALAQLRNQHIVTVHEVGLLDGHVAFVMELAERNLEQVTAGRPQDQRESAETVRLLALAIQSAHEHSKRLVHQDLKPSNILVMPDGVAKIADFGLMRSAGDDSVLNSGTVVGSPGYLAPEQVQGRAVSFATDVWGLGGILYFLLTGAPPFEKRRDRIEDVITNPLRSPGLVRAENGGDALDTRLEAIVTMCLMKSPEDRYERAIDLARDLQRFLHEKDVLAPLQLNQQRVSPSRWVLAGGILLLVVVVAIPGVGKLMRSESSRVAIQISPTSTVAIDLPLKDVTTRPVEPEHDTSELGGPIVPLSFTDREMAARLEQTVDAMRPPARHVQNACSDFRSRVEEVAELAAPEFKPRWEELIARQPPVTVWMLNSWMTRIESLHRAIGSAETTERLRQLAAELDAKRAALEEFGTTLDADLIQFEADLKQKRLARIDQPTTTRTAESSEPAPSKSPNGEPIKREETRTASAKPRRPHDENPPIHKPKNELPDNSKLRDNDQDKSSKTPEPVVFFTRTFDSDFKLLPVRLTLEVTDAPDVWSFVPAGLEPDVRMDPGAAFSEDWTFESVPIRGRGKQTVFQFRRTLRVRYAAEGRQQEQTLDVRGSTCSSEVARRMWAKGKYRFIAEPKQMSLHHETHPYAESPGPDAENVRFYWAGATNNHYSLTVSGQNVRVWSLVPVDE